MQKMRIAPIAFAVFGSNWKGETEIGAMAWIIVRRPPHTSASTGEGYLLCVRTHLITYDHIEIKISFTCATHPRSRVIQQR